MLKRDVEELSLGPMFERPVNSSPTGQQSDRLAMGLPARHNGYPSKTFWKRRLPSPASPTASAGGNSMSARLPWHQNHQNQLNSPSKPSTVQRTSSSAPSRSIMCSLSETRLPWKPGHGPGALHAKKNHALLKPRCCDWTALVRSHRNRTCRAYSCSSHFCAGA